MLTRDLKKSTDNLVVHGKLIINLSTNLDAPARGNLAPSNNSNASRPSLHTPQGSTSSGFAGVSTPSSHTQPSGVVMANGAMSTGPTPGHPPAPGSGGPSAVATQA